MVTHLPSPFCDVSPWARFSGPNLAYLQEQYERYCAGAGSVAPDIRALFDRHGPPPLPAEPTSNGHGTFFPPSHPRPLEESVGEGVSPASSPPLPLGEGQGEGVSPVGPGVGRASVPAGLPTAAVGGRRSAVTRAIPVEPVAAAVRLARAIRLHGHRAASLDPLGMPPPGDEELLPEYHGVREEDLAALPATLVVGPLGQRVGSALAAIRALRQAYQGATGYEFGHVSNAEERWWLHEAVESGRFRPPQDPINERALLDRLTEVGALERFLQRTFPGQTRFSLEGLGMLVPVLDEIIGAAAEEGTRSVIIGMAHRGRLNVLAHILCKPYEQIIGEFMGYTHRPGIGASDLSDIGWTGDVKYHMGARRAVAGGEAVDMIVALAPNPSHLEFVDPVVVGMARAANERRDHPGPARQDEQASLAVLIHGDASFPGQGVVAETLNLSGLPGYRVGGALHVIANNQLGFTTLPEAGRSTLYASDLAKGFEIPIIHVNADDPEACLCAARLAHAYRERFHEDVVIDLIGYRRWGHNEGDEPSFTQPLMYARVAQHPTVRDLWAQELVHRGLITAEEAEQQLHAAIERLHAIRQRLQEQGPPPPQQSTAGREAGGRSGGIGAPGPEVDTAVPLDTLAALNEHLYTVPAGFHLHPKLARPFERRREALRATADRRPLTAPGERDAERTPDAPQPPADEQPTQDGRRPSAVRGPSLDWAYAETLAFASILADGTPIRLTGQDTARGTFSQRHLVLHDVENGRTYTPLQALPQARASFDVWDSPLSEQGPLGFEFGYSVQAPEALVLWEAQYGDFINAGQAIIDTFIASARSKWDQQPSLVLLLPHAYEGQGPEHSSARVERFLQMAAEDNLRIANVTTAAQYFHILRRQAGLLRRTPARPEPVEGRARQSPNSAPAEAGAASPPTDPRPLVLLTPKSLLRHPLSASPLEELATGRFHPILDDPAASRDPQAVRRLMLCSGKVYVDLAATGRLAGSGPDASDWLAVARLEELYPFPAEEIAHLIACYPRLEEMVWLQEEPRNMGAWTYVAPRLRDILTLRLPLVYVGRTRRASPAEGVHEWHAREQQRVLDAAFAVQVRSEA